LLIAIPPVRCDLPRNPLGKGISDNSDSAISLAYLILSVKPNKKSASPLFSVSNLMNSMIKNFSFLLSPKTGFEPIVFPGSLAVLKSSGEAAQVLGASLLPPAAAKCAQTIFKIVHQY
jgi:hypothetical protein